MLINAKSASFPRRESDCSVRSLLVALFKKIDVRSRNQTRPGNVQPFKKLVSLLIAVLQRLPSAQNNFELDEEAEAIDLVQMNPGSPDEKHFSPFHDGAANGQDAAERVRESPRILTGESTVHRLFRTQLVRALI